MSRKKVGVLVSGRGSNLQALIDAAADPVFPAEIAVVISNIPAVQALDRADKAGIPAFVIPHRGFPSREAFDNTVDSLLREMGVDIVCLAGFMRLLSPGFVEGWAGKMLNVHPSLLPSFKGMNTHQRALDAGVKLHGCTVHLVTAGLDDGPILVQAAVPVLEQDTLADLTDRVLLQEHKCLPQAVKLLAEGRVMVVGNRAMIRHGNEPDALGAPLPLSFLKKKGLA